MANRSGWWDGHHKISLPLRSIYITISPRGFFMLSLPTRRDAKKFHPRRQSVRLVLKVPCLGMKFLFWVVNGQFLKLSAVSETFPEVAVNLLTSTVLPHLLVFTGKWTQKDKIKIPLSCPVGLGLSTKHHWRIMRSIIWAKHYRAIVQSIIGQ